MRNILVAIDGSSYSKKAVKYGVDLAKKFSVPLKLLHVVPNFRSVPDSFRRYAEIEGLRGPLRSVYIEKLSDDVLSGAESIARNAGVKATRIVEIGYPPRTIVEIAKREKIDTIIVGSRGLGAVKGFLLGSVSDRVVFHTPCTVIVVR